MTDPIENELRRALRPVQAPPGFADKVLRAAKAAPVDTSPVMPARSGPRFKLWLPALAASVLVMLLGGQYIQQHRAESEGIQARQQLMDALRLTSDKLDIVYRSVNPPPAPATDEENPS